MKLTKAVSWVRSLSLQEKSYVKSLGVYCSNRLIISLFVIITSEFRDRPLKADRCCFHKSVIKAQPAYNCKILKRRYSHRESLKLRN